ncbi:MAG: hypothetical protein BWY15_00419 [Firmicutes bacterium ADurb.Bin193]|nr:MAG: hypothetical protein BWY15_00419 [Firmicutes bacterium ADurb.Bin193]
MLTPQIKETAQPQYATRTYRLDTVENRILGKIDGLEAVRQSIFKLLSTEKNAYDIYTEYGIELEQLVGTDFLYATSMAKKLITEALMSDDRILSVEDFEFENESDHLVVNFTIYTIYGSVNEGVSI